MKTINPEFGENLVSLRKEVRTLVRAPDEPFGWKWDYPISQKRFAELSGIPLGTIRDVEQGKREPGFGIVQRWITALQGLGVAVTLNDLPPMYEEDVPPSPPQLPYEETPPAPPPVQPMPEPVIVTAESAALAAAAVIALKKGDKKEAMKLAKEYMDMTGQKVPLA